MNIEDWSKLKTLGKCAQLKKDGGLELTPEEAEALAQYAQIDGRSFTSRGNGCAGGAPAIDGAKLAADYQAAYGPVLTSPDGIFQYYAGRWQALTERDIRNGIAEFLQRGQVRSVGGRLKPIPCNRLNIDLVFTNLPAHNGYGHTPPCWLDGGEGRRRPGLHLVMQNGILDTGLAALALCHELGPVKWLGEVFSLQGEAWQAAREGDWAFAAESALSPHSKDLWTRYWLPYDFNPRATCPEFEKAVARTLPDPEVRRCFQMLCGYCLVGVRHLQAFGFLYGPAGTGKTFLLTMLASVLTGAYPLPGVTRRQVQGNVANVCNRPLSSLANRFHRAAITRALLNAVTDNASETKGWAGWEAAEGDFLTATGGGGTITADEKFNPEIRERPVTAFTIFCGNTVPPFMLSKKSFRERIRLIPCTTNIRGTKCDDKELAVRLFDLELEGIFNWCLRGLGMLMREGDIPQPRAGAEVIEQLRFRKDPHYAARVWARERLELADGGAIPVAQAFDAYVDDLGGTCELLRTDDFRGAIMEAFGVKCETPQRKGVDRLKSFMGLAWKPPAPPPSTPQEEGGTGVSPEFTK